MQSKTKEAVDAGCKDPMIHYLYVRDHLHTELSADEYGLRFAQAAADLGASDYPPVRKFYAHMRAYKANLDPWKPLEERRRAPYELAWRAMESMVNDRAVPVTEIYDALAEWMDTFRLTQLDEYVRDRIIAPILDTWGATVEAQLLHARFQISYGWRARGGGFAGSVREEAWKLFYDRVRLAETILHQINARAPEDIRAPILMMEVAVDLQYSRADMETWFQKAMRLDPNSYLACTRKLRYLDPKWYGSSADMLAFANECVESTAWGGSVPLIMVDVHEAISRYQTSPAEREAYWKKPRVWKDLQKAFDTFLARNPDASEYRHNYAKYAYLCQQWTVLKEQLKYVLQGKVHYDYFGGREAFEKMVAQSEANQ